MSSSYKAEPRNLEVVIFPRLRERNKNFFTPFSTLENIEMFRRNPNFPLNSNFRGFQRDEGVSDHNTFSIKTNPKLLMHALKQSMSSLRNPNVLLKDNFQRDQGSWYLPARI
jgi:hypothetical protein